MDLWLNEVGRAPARSPQKALRYTTLSGGRAKLEQLQPGFLTRLAPRGGAGKARCVVGWGKLTLEATTVYIADAAFLASSRS